MGAGLSWVLQWVLCRCGQPSMTPSTTAWGVRAPKRTPQDHAVTLILIPRASLGLPCLSQPLRFPLPVS